MDQATTTQPANAPGEDDDLDLTRHIIDFDPRRPQHYAYAATPGSEGAIALATATTMTPVPWPAHLAPTPVHLDPAPTENSPLPKADVLVVTYTVAEAVAAADVLTPGVSVDAWTRYRHKWAELKKHVAAHAPSLESDCAGAWAMTMIGDQRVIVMKSDLHPATDGIDLPIRALWRQLIGECKPSLVITTGTAGGVGAQTVLGDVIVAQHVRWDCTHTFKATTFAHTPYICATAPDTAMFAEAMQSLIPVNAARLPAADRPPVIVSDTADAPVWTISTDFFAFDDASDHYHLRAYQADAHAVEMDDAALALACTDLADPLPWVSVRNASDPQMNGASITAEKKQAAQIYEKYGYLTTIGSAITSWALIAARAA